MAIATLAIDVLRGPAQQLRRAYRKGFSRWLPVTFSEEEFAEKKRRLDGSARQTDSEGPGKRDRLGELAVGLGLSREVVEGFAAEAEAVELAPARDEGGCVLPSPMSLRDRVLLYAIVRAIRPEVAVETGVSGGCSSATILAAMARNGAGKLFGIDSLEVGRERLGERIPVELRDRFTLIHGDSLATLAQFQRDGLAIELFLHDSLHTYRHARAEYELAWSLLRAGGALCSHDILYNNAFERFCRRHAGEIRARAEIVNFGVGVKGSSY